MPQTAATSVERFHVNHVASVTRALIYLVTLTFHLLALNLVRILARMVCNLPTNFGIYGTFPSRLMGQQLSDAPRNIATLTLNVQWFSF